MSALCRFGYIVDFRIITKNDFHLKALNNLQETFGQKNQRNYKI